MSHFVVRLAHLQSAFSRTKKFMGWSIGYDNHWMRDIGYGVPCKCDHPDCDKDIDRGLSYVCRGSEPYGGEDGCGLYFCEEHMGEKCEHQDVEPKPDVKEWVEHKLNDESWAEWRKNNPDEVSKLKKLNANS